MIYIVCANRFYELDIELTRILLAENRQFRVIRTKFDIDFTSEFRDKWSHRSRLKKHQNFAAFNQDLCSRLKLEFHGALLKQSKLNLDPK